jgi:hypothetical protein
MQQRDPADDMDRWAADADVLEVEPVCPRCGGDCGGCEEDDRG